MRKAFTLIELLATITIISILAGLMFGAVQMAQNAGREYATKVTIAKLHTIIMERYESYMTRRVPISTSGLTPKQAAQDRLYAIRDIMRMEMPDRNDKVAGVVVGEITDAPIVLPNSGKSVPRPALSQLYANRLASATAGTGVGNGAAELLYMIVSMGSPEAMEQFNTSEIGDTNSNGLPEFLDGWGRPIFFLRWAPGFSPYSDIQKADPVGNHDPFDPRQTDSSAYQLFPLIYSGGPNNDPGLEIQANYHFGNTAAPGATFSDAVFPLIGRPANGATSYGGITNHHIGQR